ncbi:glycerol-3-phosphate dehydrogenase (NAD(P)+) [Entomoplasma freundtii]|uniref:Glycerol-3-phosphate dehydrogenase [NAD(P)+] n=1 Tax=Entomoplasma freundtii TaxID=74700 RepID=A0A2K8NUX9_9MOLU|nr:NAD(P)H-dependent glycerol-3-phosphate dehydrogenase [Entomoplasma freundtii]ATZ16571.1 NAD(P)H-dependent glycerol-3-phosphate dehydrogenase [Entomoplasma freundtii]TDY58263.1 glycerol-3-phosphate dehydrogenase (NAD(P)+) [Entomoplasma freundtii]
MKKNFTIIGSGAYGTCLANVLADNGHEVVIYGISESEINDIKFKHQNSQFFGDAKLNQNILATTNLEAALAKTEILILAVPTKALHSVIAQLKATLTHEVIILNTAKGLAPNGDLLSTYIQKDLHDFAMVSDYGALYGPSIASEVVRRLPTGVTLVMKNKKLAKSIANNFQNEYFAIGLSDDFAGCEIAAALKNGIAIGSGILDGLNAGDNARASLIAKGLREIYEISQVFGGRLETVLTYASVGDLVLTATSPKSRNYSLGHRIAIEGNPKETMENLSTTTEGVEAVKIAHQLCEKNHIPSEIFLNLYEILYNFKRPIVLVNNFLK